MKVMRAAADELERQCRKFNTARQVTSGVGLLGAIVAGVGIVLIPATGGASLAIAGACVGAAAAAAAGGAGASYAAKKYVQVLEEDHIVKMEKIVDRDKTQCERVENLWKEFDGCFAEVFQGIKLRRGDSDSDDNILQEFTEIKNAVAPIEEVTGVQKHLGLVIVIGKFNLKNFLESSVKANKESISNVAEDIREKASELDRQCTRWKAMFPV